MIHSLLSAAAALVLLPAGTAFMATLIRPQLAPVSHPKAESGMSEWWRSIPCTDLGVVPRDAHLTLTAGAGCAVLSGAGDLTARSVPLHLGADGLCALRFRCTAATTLECTLPPECAGAGCPTGALSITHERTHTSLQLPAGAGECCIIWRTRTVITAGDVPDIPLATR